MLNFFLSGHSIIQFDSFNIIHIYHRYRIQIPYKREKITKFIISMQANALSMYKSSKYMYIFDLYLVWRMQLMIIKGTKFVLCVEILNL